MPNDPLVQLPSPELIESGTSVRLRTSGIVLPARRLAGYDQAVLSDQINSFATFIRRQGMGLHHPSSPFALPADAVTTPPSMGPWANRLVHGDNLVAMAALLAGDSHTPSLRGLVHLIYADVPAFDAAHCRSRLAARLILMRELLAQTGSMIIRLDQSMVYGVLPMLEHVLGVDHMLCIQLQPKEVLVRYCKSPSAVGHVPYQACPTLLHAHSANTHQQAAHAIAHMVQHMTRPEDVVADLYARAGTTAVVAEKLGRRWIAVERDAQACQQIRRRLSAHKVKSFLFQVIFG
jgi:adenine-specific DNA-methyltransferase